MGLKILSRIQRHPRKENAPAEPRFEPPATPARKAATYEPADTELPESDPLKRLWQQGQHMMIVRQAVKWRTHPGGNALLDAAAHAMEDRFALVPEGTVSMPTTLSSEPGSPEIDIDVEPFLLAQHAVTNAEFQRFVDDDGYNDLDLWPKDIWPHLIELHDQTGAPAPRYWFNGRYDKRLANHPVVGVSWFEASAYANWAGLRLPTEAEWQMAASWHIRSSADVYRRFPWGDAMDRSRCNMWAAGLAETAPVDAYLNGAAPNSVLQLIGNVWEWMATDFEIATVDGQPVIGEMPMKGVRGAAFDTYFESQATSSFRTGQIALARSHNTGFRCALNLKDASWLKE